MVRRWSQRHSLSQIAQAFSAERRLDRLDGRIQAVERMRINLGNDGAGVKCEEAEGEGLKLNFVLFWGLPVNSWVI